MPNNRRLVFPALVVAGVLWGTTVPLSKLALDWLAPAWLAFGRFALAAAVLMVVSRSKLRSACSPAILLSGAVGYGGSVLLQNVGIERTSVTHAALLIGATPVLVAIMAAVLGHSVARPVAWAGFVLSLAGVGFIAGGQGSGSTLGGDALVLAGQLASAGFTVSQARLLRGRDPIAVTALQLMAAAAAMLPVALTTEAHPTSPASMTAVLATVGLVLAGTVLPTALFAFGQGTVSADVAGAFLNLEPLVGAAMGIALFADPLGPVQVAGGAAIVAGIALSSYQVVRGERIRRLTAPSLTSGVPGRAVALCAPVARAAVAHPAAAAAVTRLAMTDPAAGSLEPSSAEPGSLERSSLERRSLEHRPALQRLGGGSAPPAHTLRPGPGRFASRLRRRRVRLGPAPAGRPHTERRGRPHDRDRRLAA